MGGTYAPTMRKRTSAATNARNRSTKSGFMRQVASQPPDFLAEPPDLKDAFSVGYPHPELEVVPIGFGRGGVPTYRHPCSARVGWTRLHDG